MEDYESYSQRAKLMTQIHAVQDEAGSWSKSTSPTNDTDLVTTKATSSCINSVPDEESVQKKAEGEADKKKAAKKRSLKRL